MAQAMLKGSAAADDISTIEYEQFRIYVRCGLFNLRRSFADHSDGVLDDSEFEDTEKNAQFFLGQPGVRSEWQVQRRWFAPEFAAWVDRLVAEPPAGNGEDSFSRWKAANGARRATALQERG
jgi:hypothetical protein